MDLKALIRTVPDFPQPGVQFRDITPLLAIPVALDFILHRLEEHARECEAEVIVGIESRGFIFASPVADRLKLPLVPVRKAGKLPAARMSVEYTLEYGESQLDIHADAIRKGQRIYIVDDLLATAGTARATAKLVELVEGVVAGLGFVVELDGLGGRRHLEGYEAFSVVHYEADE